MNSYSYIFSPRPWTPAAEKKVSSFEVNKKRLKKLQEILKNIQLKNNKESDGKYHEVLVENKLNNQEKYFGRTKCMLPAIFESENCKPGELINIKITSFNQNNLFGHHKINKIKAA